MAFRSKAIVNDGVYPGRDRGLLLCNPAGGGGGLTHTVNGLCRYSKVVVIVCIMASTFACVAVCGAISQDFRRLNGCAAATPPSPLSAVGRGGQKDALEFLNGFDGENIPSRKMGKGTGAGMGMGMGGAI